MASEGRVSPSIEKSMCKLENCKKCEIMKEQEDDGFILVNEPSAEKDDMGWTLVDKDGTKKSPKKEPSKKKDEEFVLVDKHRLAEEMAKAQQKP